MKIILLAHRVPYPPNKGEKIRTFHQIKYLRESGHEVSILTVQQSAQDIQYGQELASVLGVDVTVHPAGFRKGRMLTGLISNKTLSVCNFQVRSLQQQFDHRLQGNELNIVLCTSSAMASYVFNNTRLAADVSSGPTLVMDFMDLDSDKWLQYSRHAGFVMASIYRREAALLLRYEKSINKRFSHCLFVTSNEVDLFKSRGAPYPERLAVVGNGVDTQAFYPASDNKKAEVATIDPQAAQACRATSTTLAGSSNDTDAHSTQSKSYGNKQWVPELVFVGVMDYRPNEDAVCWFVDNLWHSVRQRWPAARFTVVGISPSEAVKRLARLPGIEVTGKVENVLPFLHRANIFIAPFRLARGIQNKVLQAFAAGIPVITSACGAEGIECRHGKHLLVANSSDEIMQAIDTLMQSPDKYALIRDNALRLVKQRYSWQGQNRGDGQVSAGSSRWLK